MRRRTSGEASAQIAQYAPEILQNAIEVNRGKAHPDEAKIEHVMVGAIHLDKGKSKGDYAVRLFIYNRKGKQAQLDKIEVIGKLHAMKEKKTILRGFQSGNAKGTGNVSSSPMKISAFINDVKNDLDDTFPDAVPGQRKEDCHSLYPENSAGPHGCESYHDAAADCG